MVCRIMCCAQPNVCGMITRLGNRVVVGEQGAVAVPKVQAPELEVFVCRPAGQKGAVAGDVQRQHRQLVAVQGQEELEAVRKQHLHAARLSGAA